MEAARAVGPVPPPPGGRRDPAQGQRGALDDPGRFRQRRRAFTTWPLPFYVGPTYPLRPAPRLTHLSLPARDPRRQSHQPVGRGEERDHLEAPDLWLMATATVETPVVLPLEQRVTMHLTAIDAPCASSPRSTKPSSRRGPLHGVLSSFLSPPIPSGVITPLVGEGVRSRSLLQPGGEGDTAVERSPGGRRPTSRAAIQRA